MAKSGSAACALRNCSAASEYSKLWSSASPRRKGSCAAGAPELANDTSPTSVCAGAGELARKRTSSNGNAVWRIGHLRAMLNHQIPTVDVERGPRDVPGGLRGQEAD